jgi:hypothetical protein
MESQFLIRRAGYTRSRLYAAVIVGETKSQWKAHELDSDGNDTGREIRVTKRTGKEVGTSRTYWSLLTDATNLPEMLAAERARREEERVKRDEQGARREAKVEQAKAALKGMGWVSEELGLYKAEYMTPKSGLVVLVYTVEQREALYGAPGVTLRVTGYNKTEYGVSGGSSSVNGPDVETALAGYVAAWHWD